MPKRSTKGDVVRRSSADTVAASPEHLGLLVAAMNSPIDTSEMPESKGPARQVDRDANGRLRKRKLGPIRTAILEGLRRREMTRYELWQAARAYCKTLTSSAVYEYLRGERDIGVPYVEALMEAVGVVVSVPKMSRRTIAPRPAAVATLKATAKPPVAKRRGSKVDS